MSREFGLISPKFGIGDFCTCQLQTLGAHLSRTWRSARLDTLNPDAVMGRLGLARLPGVHAVVLVVRSPNDCPEELGVIEWLKFAALFRDVEMTSLGKQGHRYDADQAGCSGVVRRDKRVMRHGQQPSDHKLSCSPE